MKTPSFWEKKGIAARLLWPASMGFLLAGHLRLFFARPTKVEKPVLCVGNLVAGGAGKTPACLLLAQIFRARGKQVYALCRGYGGNEKGPLKVEIALQTAEEVGDEALLLATALPTVISHDRVMGARKAIQLGAEIIMMDDGFQNPHLEKTANLLIIDGAYGFGNEMIIPAGPLREPVINALTRASAVLIVGDATHPAIGPALVGFAKPVFYADIMPNPEFPTEGGILAFSGIARPEKFFRSLEKMGCVVEDKIAFEDHHLFTRRELDSIFARAQKKNLRIVTTAKDLVRLPIDMRRRVEVLEITLVPRNEPALTAWLDEVLQ